MEEKPILKENIILSIAIFSHGGEDYSKTMEEPFASFYKNNVRVFSRACLPGMSSFTNTTTRSEEIARMINICQDKDNQMKSTNELLEQHMCEIKPSYIAQVNSSTISSMYPEITRHTDKMCGTSTYLSPKTFEFDEGDGIYLVDVRKQIIYDDGSVEYEILFKPKAGKALSKFDVEYWNILKQEGMKYMLEKFKREPIKNAKVTEKNTAYEILLRGHKTHYRGSIIALPRTSTDLSTRTNLEGIYDLCKYLGIDYLNIVDNACRVSLSSKQLTEHEILELHEREQAKKNIGEFGGKNKKRTRVVKKIKKRHTTKTHKKGN